MEAWEAARNALECVLQAEKGESIVIFCDEEKVKIGEAFTQGALDLGLKTRLTTLKTQRNTYRKEIPELVQGILKENPTIYINLLRGIREEVPFRIQLIHLETKDHKSRLGHCPGVTMDMLTEGALALKKEEHGRMQSFAQALMQKLSGALKVEVTSPSGTDLVFSVEDRKFFTDTIIDKKTLKWMNLPTGEAIVAPVEDSLEGELFCDMAVGGIGPIKEALHLTVHRGAVKEFASKNQNVLHRVKDSLQTDDNSRIVGEFAFGINPKARFVDEFLEAEKILGTIHFAFGNNSDFPGGRNPSKNHLDLLISKPTVRVFYKDGSQMEVLDEGCFSKV